MKKYVYVLKYLDEDGNWEVESIHANMESLNMRKAQDAKEEEYSKEEIEDSYEDSKVVLLDLTEKSK